MMQAFTPSALSESEGFFQWAVRCLMLFRQDAHGAQVSFVNYHPQFLEVKFFFGVLNGILAKGDESFPF